MSQRLRGFTTALALLSLGAAACGNSEDGGSSAPDTGAAGAGGATETDEADRDTFEEITGVPGVTDDAITFAVIGVKSNNALGTCVLDCYQEGIEAYFAHRNAEGGIYGRELRVGSVMDDEMAQNQARALDVISSDDAFAVFNAPLVASGFGDLDAAGVPTYSWGIHGTEAAGRETVFPSRAPQCGDCTFRAVPYTAQLVGATKVGALGYGISENSKDCANASAASTERYGADVGAEVGYVNDSLSYGLPNGIAPEVTAMKREGVDFIALCLDLNGAKTLAQELARQGMGDVPMYHPNTYDHQFVAEAGDLFEGDVVAVQFTPFEAERSGSLDAFLTWMEETGAEPTELAMVGWINADAAFTSLLAAGPQFDRESAIAAMNSITDYDAGGLLNPIDWTRQHNPPTEDDRSNDYAQECLATVRVVDGAFDLADAPPDKPWMCWSNDNRDWAEPVPTSFDG
jgi:ABC-type branched-subunit amino acid transport system substrate-binding protein